MTMVMVLMERTIQTQEILVDDQRRRDEERKRDRDDRNDERQRQFEEKKERKDTEME